MVIIGFCVVFFGWIVADIRLNADHGASNGSGAVWVGRFGIIHQLHHVEWLLEFNNYVQIIMKENGRM